MNQAELEARLAAIAPGGDTTKLKYVESTATREVTDTSGLNPTKVKKQVPVRTWYDPATGQAIKVDVNDDGTYAKTFDGVDKTLRQSATASDGPPGGKAYIDEEGPTGRRLGWNPATKSYDRDLGPSPSAQQPQTGSAKKPVPGKPGFFEVTTTNKTTNQTETHYEDGSGNTVQLPADPTASDKKPVVGHPGYFQVTTQNPTTKQSETHYEDANGATVQLPPDVKAGTIVKSGGVNGEDVQAVEDPTTHLISYQPIAGAKPGVSAYPVEPAGAPPRARSVGELTQDAQDYSDWLSQQVDAYRKSGGTQGVSPVDADKLLQRRLDLAKSELGEQTALSNQASAARSQDITQRQQDLGEVASRRTASTGTFQNVFDQINQNARYLGPGGGGLAAKAFVDALDLSEAKARQVGGYQDVPQIAPTPTQSNRTIKIGKDGSVSIAVPHPTPAPEQPAAAAAAPPSGDAQAASPAQGGMQPGTNPNNPDPSFSPSSNWFTPSQPSPPTVSAIRPSGPVPFDPSGTVTQLRAAGVPQDVIDQAVAEHQQEMAQAA